MQALNNDFDQLDRVSANWIAQEQSDVPGAVCIPSRRDPLDCYVEDLAPSASNSAIVPYEPEVVDLTGEDAPPTNAMAEIIDLTAMEDNERRARLSEFLQEEAEWSESEQWLHEFMDRSEIPSHDPNKTLPLWVHKLRQAILEKILEPMYCAIQWNLSARPETGRAFIVTINNAPWFCYLRQDFTPQRLEALIEFYQPLSN